MLEGKPSLRGNERLPFLGGVILAHLYTVSLIVQDMGPLQEVLGRYGANLSIIFVPIWLVYWLVTGDISLGRAIRPWLKVTTLWIYFGTLVSLIRLLYLPIEYRGEILWVKTVKVLITIVTWVISILVGYWIGRSQAKSIKFIVFSVWGLLLFLLGIEVVNPNSGMFVQGLFHLKENIQQRPRLLTPEASVAGSLVASLGLLASCSGGKMAKIVIPLVTAAALSLIRSKGTIIVWAVAYILGYLGEVGAVRRKRVLKFTSSSVILALFVPVFLVILVPAYEALMADYYESTSGITRLTFVVSALFALVSKPFGAGFGAYLVNAEEWVDRALLVLSRMVPTRIGLSEVMAYLWSSDDYAFAPKELPSTLIWYTGVFGLAYFAFCAWWLLKWSRKLDAVYRVAAIFVTLATSSYITSLYEYHLTLLTGVILARGELEENSRTNVSPEGPVGWFQSEHGANNANHLPFSGARAVNQRGGCCEIPVSQ